jgi:uncharacterized protein
LVDYGQVNSTVMATHEKIRRLPRLERTKCMHECVRVKLKLLGLARLGSVEAQFQLGNLYFESSTVFRNESIRWLQRAAQKRHARAFELLYLRASCHSYHFDDRARFRRLLRAAKLGDAEAQYTLGAICATGDLAPKDLRATRTWYRRAVKRGHPEAQCNLGLMYLDGEGGVTDRERGLFLTRKAFRNGYVCVADILAEMYEDGVCGVERDPKKAEYWRTAMRCVQMAHMPRIPPH